jgi:hypothetical protein
MKNPVGIAISTGPDVFLALLTAPPRIRFGHGVISITPPRGAITHVRA